MAPGRSFRAPARELHFRGRTSLHLPDAHTLLRSRLGRHHVEQPCEDMGGASHAMSEPDDDGGRTAPELSLKAPAR